MEEEILKSIDRKLEALIKLIGGNFVQGKNKTEAIITLSSLGMDSSMIADIVGTTPATVASRLWEQKQKSGATTKTKKPKKSEIANE